MDPILLQKQVRDNAEDLQNCLKELKNWESEMKRKEGELCPGSKDQGLTANQPSVLPPVRNKVRKTEKNAKHKETLAHNNSSNRIPGYDYASWDKFDVDKACQQVDNNLEESEEDSESEEEDIETERLHDEAMYEKEKGNQFVKSQEWTNAIECYSRAIECYPYDAIFFANRALCHLKTKDLKAAETDCTSALNLDISYVKAFQRRAAARIGLGLLEEAKLDFQKVIQLEPKNSSAKEELVKIEKKINAMQNEKKHILAKEKKKADERVASSSFEMDRCIASTSRSGGKCEKADASLDWKKCWSDQENKVFKRRDVTSLGLRKDASISTISSIGAGDEKASTSQDLKKCVTDQGNKAVEGRKVTRLSPVKDESVASTSSSTEGCQIVYPIHKPPHLRSKKPMKEIDIKIINSGMSKKPADLTDFKTYPKVIEVEEAATSKVTDIVEPVKIERVDSSTGASKVINKQTKSPMVAAVKPTEDISNVPPPPMSYIDFYAAWKNIKHSPKMKFLYLKQTPGEQLSKMFHEFLESATFSELIETLEMGFLPAKEPVYPYLLGMSNVKRLSALTLFMNNVDRTRMEMLLDSCERLGECSKEEGIILKKKFEL